jgi:hypothetical protein
MADIWNEAGFLCNCPCNFSEDGIKSITRNFKNTVTPKRSMSSLENIWVSMLTARLSLMMNLKRSSSGTRNFL